MVEKASISPAVLPSLEIIESQVLTVRGQRVLLAPQLAVLYEVETRVLNQAVQRNASRFPADFMFQLSWEEVDSLKSQTVILNAAPVAGDAGSGSQTVILKRGQNVKYAPYAFTEQGVAMLSGVLRSDRAISVNIEIMRTFVKLRGMLAEHSDLKRKLDQLEKKYDDNFKVVFQAIAQLMDEPKPGSYGSRRIGFTKESKDK